MTDFADAPDDDEPDDEAAEEFDDSDWLLEHSLWHLNLPATDLHCLTAVNNGTAVPSDWASRKIVGRKRKNGTLPPVKDSEVHAVAICAECPSQDPCLQHALDNRLTEDIYGGLTPNQRVRLDEESA